MNLSGSPMDQRIRNSSPRKGPWASRSRRWARSRSICSTERSRRVRSQRPIDLSCSANLETVAAVTRIPSSARVATASVAVAACCNARMTPTSSGRKRKYLWVVGSLTM